MRLQAWCVKVQRRTTLLPWRAIQRTLRTRGQPGRMATPAMCGIAGSFGLDPRAQADLLRRMVLLLRPRGPDGCGMWQRELAHGGPTVELGQTRLAILDLSPLAAQPMVLEQDRWVIAYNGEVYNFKELRGELQALGHTFKSTGDTEVILHACAQWGVPAALERLRGIFALAAWDEAEQTLWLARDRLGVKPLCYAQVGDELVFASEPKAVLAWHKTPDRMDARALADYLAYLYIPAPRSIYEGVHKLQPGHLLRVRAGVVEEQRWWQPKPAQAPSSLADAADAVRALVQEAVREQMLSDVPLGVYLSGGVDSSAIAACMVQAASGPVRSFAIGYDGEDAAWNEADIAERVAKQLGCQHTTLLATDATLDMVPTIAARFDEPYGNPTAVLAWMLAKLSRPHITVALAGDGGDELFLGYPRYRAVWAAEALQHVPNAMGRPLGQATARLAGRLGTKGTAVRRFAEGFGLPRADRYARWQTYIDGDARQSLLSAQTLEQIGSYETAQVMRDAMAGTERLHGLDAAIQADLATFLPSNLLDAGDRMSMAHGLEVRVPLLDHRLVELALGIAWPQKLDVWHRQSKIVFKRALEGLVPAEVLQRPKKGFNPPIGAWIGRNLDGLQGSWLAPELVREAGVFSEAGVQALVAEHRGKTRDRGNELWAIAVFHAWWGQERARKLG